MAAIELSMPDLMKHMTLDMVVTGQREASIRIWLGTRLLKLGAWVMGCGVNVEVSAKTEECP